MKAQWKLAAFAVVLIVSAGASAQVPPGLDPASMIREYMEALPSAEMKVEGVELKYKEVPGSTKQVIEQLDKRWADILRGASKVVENTLHSLLEEVGTLKTRREITYKKNKLPPGEYTFGIFVEEGVPRYIGISGKELDGAIRIKFKSQKRLPESQTLKIKGKIKKKDRLEITLAYGPRLLKLPALRLGEIQAEEEKKDEAEKATGEEEDG
ncbi:MAG: hypothetical protein O6952_09530 [Planctomycetota bacterium]|nr:hypothetical protein [Planctomycetota bacterium]